VHYHIAQCISKNLNDEECKVSANPIDDDAIDCYGIYGTQNTYITPNEATYEPSVMQTLKTAEKSISYDETVLMVRPVFTIRRSHNGNS